MKKSATLAVMCGAFALLCLVAVHASADAPVEFRPSVTLVSDAGVGSTLDAGSAAAPTPTAPPMSPFLENATAAPDSAWDLVEQYGWIWGSMLLLFGATATFIRRNEKEHWLKQGRALALLVAGVGVLGAVLEAALNGGTWAGVLVTAMAAIKLVLSPTTPQPTQAST